MNFEAPIDEPEPMRERPEREYYSDYRAEMLEYNLSRMSPEEIEELNQLERELEN